MPSLEAEKEKFAKLDTEIVAVSVDHIATLKAWAFSLGGISYPLASDFWPHGDVARKYGVLREDDGFAERAILVVDKGGKITYIDVHKLDEPPDVEEILDAVREVEKPSKTKRAA